MRNAWTKEACCDGKQAYESAKLAAEIVKRSRRNKAQNNIVSYRCPFCGLWHIGREYRK